MVRYFALSLHFVLFILSPIALAQVPGSSPFGFGGASAPVVLGSTISNTNPICTNGNVYAVHQATATRTIIGGDFTSVGNCAGFGFPYDLTNSRVKTGYVGGSMGANGPIYTSIPDGAGGWYIGGDFTMVGGLPRNRVAHIDSNGIVDPVFSTPHLNLNKPVRALSLLSGQLYIGGEFDSFGLSYGTILNESNGYTDVNVNLQNGSSFSGAVHASIPDGNGGWFVGGDFTTFNGKTVTRLARISADGTLDESFNPAPNGLVRVLLLESGSLYVGGDFTSIGGIDRSYLAQLSPTTGLASSWTSGVSSSVYALKKLNNGRLAVGGSFVLAGAGSLIGTRGAAYDVSTRTLQSSWPSVNGTINKVIPDGDGGFYIGGSFTSVGGQARAGVARIDSSGSVTSFNANISGTPTVNALLLNGSVLYIGGLFTTVGGLTRQNLAAVNASTGALDTTLNIAFTDSVQALATDGTSLFVGGIFTFVGGMARSGFAVLTLSTHTVDTSWTVTTSGGDVRAIFVDGNNLYIGGNFTTIGGNARTRLALYAIDTKTIDAWNPAPNNTVNAITKANGKIYIGGSFTYIPNTFRYGLAAFDASTKILTSLDANLGSSTVVTDLFSSGNELFIVGNISYAFSSSRYSAFSIDTTNDTLTSFIPKVQGWINSVAVSGSFIYLGGWPSGFSPQFTGSLLSIDFSDGSLGSWNTKVNGDVYAIDTDGDQIIIGGKVTQVNGQSRTKIADVHQDNGTVGTVLGAAGGASSTVKSILVADNTIYVAGDFTILDGSSREGFGAYNLAGRTLKSSWNPPVSNFNNGKGIFLYHDGSRIMLGAEKGLFAFSPSTAAADSSIKYNIGQHVRTVSRSGGKIFVGGDFTSSGSNTRRFIAGVNSISGALTAWYPATNERVSSLAVGGGRVYLGGIFSYAGGASRNRVAAVDAINGVADSWNPDVGSTGNEVRAIEYTSGTIYIAGRFSTIGGTSKTNIGAVNDTTGALIPTFLASASSDVYSLLKVGSTIYVGGLFSNLSGSSRSYFGAVDASTGADLGLNIPANGAVNTLSLVGSNLYLGGAFTTLGGQIRNKFAEIDTGSASLTSRSLSFAGDVNTISNQGSELYVGGNISIMNPLTRQRLAAIETLTGTLTNWAPKVSGAAVYAVASYGNLVIVGGDFTHVNNIPRSYLASVNIKSGRTTTMFGNTGTTGTVRTLATSGDMLYIGGDFTSITSTSRWRFGRFNLTSGLLDSLALTASNGVRTIIVSGDDVFVGGDFTAFGGYTRRRVAHLSHSTGLVSGIDPNVVGSVFTLLKNGNTLYIGGQISSIAGASRSRLGAWDLAGSVVSPWNPNVAGTQVSALRVIGNDLFVGGQFTKVGTTNISNLAVFNATTGDLRNVDLKTNSRVDALVADGSSLWVAGGAGSLVDKVRGGVGRLNAGTLQNEW